MATTTARVTPVVTKIIDGDGHLYERDEDIRSYLQGKYPEDTLRTYYLFPTLDGWRRGLPPRGHRYDAAGWAQFMDAAGISEAVLYPIERIDRRTERSGRHLATEQVRDHPVYFHAELAERRVLPLALDVGGEDRLLYASDFPHEPDDEIMEVLEAFLAREDVSQSAKQKILCGNIEALYTLKSA